MILHLWQTVPAAGLRSLTLDVDVHRSRPDAYFIEYPDNSGILHAVSNLSCLTELQLPSKWTL